MVDRKTFTELRRLYEDAKRNFKPSDELATLVFHHLDDLLALEDDSLKGWEARDVMYEQVEEQRYWRQDAERRRDEAETKLRELQSTCEQQQRMLEIKEAAGSQVCLEEESQLAYILMTARDLTTCLRDHPGTRGDVPVPRGVVLHAAAYLFGARAMLTQERNVAAEQNTVWTEVLEAAERRASAAEQALEQLKADARASGKEGADHEG